MIIQKTYSLQEAVEKREKLTRELNDLILIEQGQIEKKNEVNLTPLAEKLKELTEINKTISEKKQTESLKEKKCCKLGSWCGGYAKIGTWAVIGLQTVCALGSIAASIYIYRAQKNEKNCSRQGSALLAELISNIVSTILGGIALEGVRELGLQRDQNEVLKKIEGVRDQGEKNMEKMLETFKNLNEKNSRLQFALGCHFVRELQNHSLGENLEPNIWIAHMLEQLSKNDKEVQIKMQDLKKAAKELKEKKIKSSQEKISKQLSVIPSNETVKSKIQDQFFSSTVYLNSSDDDISGERGAFKLEKQSFLIEEENPEQEKFDRLWSQFEEDLGVEAITSIKLGKSSITRQGEIKKIQKDTVFELN